MNKNPQHAHLETIGVAKLKLQLILCPCCIDF